MKIGILTLPFHINYGGILQAYALQTILEELGHDVTIINSDRVSPCKPFLIRIISWLKRNIAKYVFRKENVHTSFNLLPKSIKDGKNIKSKNISNFIETYINITDSITTDEEHRKLIEHNYQALVVGSDQVWRLRYTSNIYTYFLDFAENFPKIKRLTYAASFGIDTWNYPQKMTKKCRALIKKFDAISVREDSAIKLCKDYLGVNALQLLDPTMLLTREDYLKLISTEGELVNSEGLFYYLLDETDDLLSIVEQCSSVFGLRPFTVMRGETVMRESQNFEKDIFPTIPGWLQAFNESKFVITDSFHGCVFSIIFNKPFIVFENEKRGLTRFKSLLKKFSLESRLFTTINYDILSDNTFNYDWNAVNKKLAEERRNSLSFLINNLTS